MTVMAVTIGSPTFQYNLDTIYSYNDLKGIDATFIGSTGLASNEYYIRANYVNGHYLAIRDIIRFIEHNDLLFKLKLQYYPEELL